ncbi:hypothetical protein [Stenotrophomonas pigmentata]|uniref:hypothetical protein n=1 Tax=Stenotrophomonas pigmentata TaxID=3055080 RepID=UPI0026F29399|nr:hypothetical protein [Stenotrophomonas sp. 610A2]
MKNQLIIATSIAAVLAAGSANAGIKDLWAKTKTTLAGNQTEGPVSEVERKDCEQFQRGVMSGSIPATPANEAKGERCSVVLAAPASQTPPAQANGNTQTLPAVEVQGQRQSEPKADMGKATNAANKGCGIGAVVGALAGVDGNIACAVGGAIGFGWSYQKQVKEARQVEEAAKAAGMNARVETTTEAGKNGKPEERLAGIVIDYVPADMQALDPKTTALLNKVEALAKKSKNTLVVRFEGGAACSIPRDRLVNSGALAKHRVEDLCGKSSAHRITITPIADSK